MNRLAALQPTDVWSALEASPMRLAARNEQSVFSGALLQGARGAREAPGSFSCSFYYSIYGRRSNRLLPLILLKFIYAKILSVDLNY